jgi:hypothetical protein
MTARTYSTWNPNALGTGLLLDQGNLVVTTGANALSNSRKVLGTLPKGGSSGYFETQFWSTPQVSLGTNVAVGVAQQTSSLASAVGADAASCGYYPATGAVIYNGSTLTTLDAIPERRVIGIFLRFAAGHAYMVITVSGSWVYGADLGTGGALWVPALTLAGGNATETSAYSNFGQRGFDYPFIVYPPA